LTKQVGQTGIAMSSRRRFLMSTTLTGAALAGGRAQGQVNSKVEESTAPASGKLKIKVAGYQYDRVAGLADGRVPIEGCAAQFEAAKIGDMNTHVFSGPRTREVTEIGLLPFILAVANEEFRDYSLIPVFPLRVFRHKSIFIRTDRGITKPSDLRGRRVATPGYSSTSLTWIRGIMQHEYGVKPEEIEWVVSAKDSSATASGGASKWESILPNGISIRRGPKGKDESELLVDGDVDALFHAAEPRAYQEGHPKVARLFADSRKTERAYFRKTGIFPIMHAVAVRRDVIQSHPWLPAAVFQAYSQAKQLTYEDIKQSAWYKTSLPWIAQEAEETRELMGDNYWPYAIKPNRKTLNALLQYSHEQGLAKRKLKIEELFHASTLDLREVPV
jgi:4,5-dihydroxyphthalate decarboxylase